MEMKAKDKQQVHSLLTTDKDTGIGQAVCCEEYGSLTRLLHVTALVLKFVQLLKRATPKEAMFSQDG